MIAVNEKAMRSCFNELESETGAIVTSFSVDMEAYIGEAMSNDLIKAFIDKNLGTSVLHTTYNRYYQGERVIFLECKWKEKSRKLALYNYRRITLDEYLDFLLEIRKQKRIDDKVAKYKSGLPPE